MTGTRTKGEPKFPVGTQFMGGGRNPNLCTVIDILKTYNQSGDLVKVRYVATHMFLGRMVTDRDVNEITISKGLIADQQS